MNLSADRRHRLLLGGVLGASLLLPLIFFLGPRTIDHFLIARYAHQVLHHQFHLTEWPQSARFGLILPVAVLEAMFGVNPGSAVALTMAFSLLHVAACYVLTRALFNREAALAAAAIAAFLPLETIQATLLYPDLPASALSVAGLAVLVIESRKERPALSRLLLAGALFGASYLVKQTVVFTLLFVGGWVLLRRLWRLWPAALPIALTVVGETVAIAVLTGDPFYRHGHINRFVADKNYVEVFAGMGPAGICLRFVWELLNPLDRSFPYMIGTAALYLAASWRFRHEPAVRFLFFLWLTGLILTTLWPVRLRPFVPALVSDGRHLAPLIAPTAAVLGAAFLRLPTRARMVAGVAYAGISLASTAMIHQYLAREDAGDRAAFAFLRESGATRIRATDNHGNFPELLQFLSGYASNVDIRHYSPQDMDGMKDEWVVVNDHTLAGGPDAPPGSRPRELRIPPPWTCVWKQSFAARWDPRSLLSGVKTPPNYEVRVFRVP